MTVSRHTPQSHDATGAFAMAVNTIVAAGTGLYTSLTHGWSELFAWMMLWLFERANYAKWIKKFLLFLLMIQFFTFFAAIIYYIAVTAATFDEQGPIMNLVFTSISVLTGGTYVWLSSIMIPPRWVGLVHDGKRGNMQKRFSLNWVLFIVIGLMVAISITEGVLVGFSPTFNFTNDDDFDAIEGILDLEFDDGDVITGEFDVIADLIELPPDFNGAIVSEDEFRDLWRNRTMSIYMLILCMSGLYAMLSYTDIYLISRRMFKFERIVSVSVRDAAGFERAYVDPDRPDHPLNVPDQWTLALWALAGGIICTTYALVVALFPRDLYVMMGVLVSLGAASAAALLLSYLFTQSR